MNTDPGIWKAGVQSSSKGRDTDGTATAPVLLVSAVSIAEAKLVWVGSKLEVSSGHNECRSLFQDA